MTPEAEFDPLAILRALAAHDVPVTVIGGFAVAAHNVVRATRDLDIVTDRSWSAAKRFAAALQDLDAQPLNDPSVSWTAEVLVRPINLRIGTRHGELRLLNSTGGIPSYSELDHVKIVVEELEVRIASLAALREMKQAAGRPKDLVDLAELDAVHGSDD